MRRHAGWGRMRRPRACLARHAPGRRRGSAWRPIGAARQELADGWPSAFPRLLQSGAGNGGKPMKPTASQERRSAKSAARRSKENAANKPGRAQACPGGAPSGAPYFREGMRAHQQQWLRHLARHPPRICAGERRSERRRAYPGPRQRIRVMAHGCFKLAV